MNPSDVQSLVSTVDRLIFSHTGEHLDDLQQAILEGAFDHQKYAEIAKKNHRSEKYVKDLAAKLWQTISGVLGEEVSKSNIRSALQRYYYNLYNNTNTNVVNDVKINLGHICNNFPESGLQESEISQQVKLEAVTELVKEGLSVEQIARALKLPLELVQQEIQKSGTGVANDLE